MKNIFAFLTLILILISPKSAFCDPFDLVDQYNQEWRMGETQKAEKTATLALKEARELFPFRSPYIAKIGFELAQIRLELNQDKDALEPIETAIKSMDAAGQTLSGIDVSEIYLVHGLALYASATDKNGIEIAISKLELATKDEQQIPYGDEFLFRAHSILAQFYYNDRKYEKSIISSSKAIKQINLLFDFENAVSMVIEQINLSLDFENAASKNDNIKAKNRALSYAYFTRAKARFINLITNRDKRAIVIEGRWEEDGFKDTLNDLIKASDLHGKSLSADDEFQNNLMAWSYLLLSFGNSNESNLKFFEKSEFAHYGDQVQIILDRGYNVKAECKKSDLLNFDVIFPQNEVTNYQFGSAVAYYDIGDDGKAKNIRIASSLPNAGFGKEVKTALKLGKPNPNSKTAPKECLKDIPLVFGFLTIMEKGTTNDYWDPIRVGPYRE